MKIFSLGLHEETIVVERNSNDTRAKLTEVERLVERGLQPSKAATIRYQGHCLQKRRSKASAWKGTHVDANCVEMKLCHLGRWCSVYDHVNQT